MRSTRFPILRSIGFTGKKNARIVFLMTPGREFSSFALYVAALSTRTRVPAAEQKEAVINRPGPVRKQLA